MALAGLFALALMFILYAKSYGSIRTFALKRDDVVQPNRDMLALGVANIVSGLFHGTPVGAAYSGTAANEAAGAQTRFAGLFAAGILRTGVEGFVLPFDISLQTRPGGCTCLAKKTAKKTAMRGSQQ